MFRSTIRILCNQSEILRLLRRIVRQNNRLHLQNREIMSLAREAIDRLVELARPLVGEVQTLTIALRAANEREAAVRAELAEFRSTDAAEDAAQLAAQDAELARHADEHAAALSAEISAIQDEEDEEPEARVDEARASESATVIVVEDAPEPELDDGETEEV